MYTDEDRVFQLLGAMKTPKEIGEILDIDSAEAYALVRKVIEERDTPNMLSLRANIERIA